MKNSTRIGILAGVLIIFLLFMPVQAYTGFIVKNTPKGSSTYQFIEITKQSPAYKIIDFKYDFGDGTNSTLHNPVHTYTKPGVYNAMLLIAWQDVNGNKYTSSNVVQINTTGESTTPSVALTTGTVAFPSNIPVSLATPTVKPTASVTATLTLPFDDYTDPNSLVGTTMYFPGWDIPFYLSPTQGLGYAGVSYTAPH